MARRNESVEVNCPCCRSVLRVDTSTGAVLTHKEPEKPKPIEDMDLAVQALKGEAQRREELFQKSLAEERARHSVMDRKFEELFKQAKESPDERPFRPDFDLD